MADLNLIAIDDLKRCQHSYLSPDDECYYILEYHSRQGFSHSAANSFIWNLKKPVNRQSYPDYKFKREAILQAIRYINLIVLPAIKLWGPCTFVPIPPSKTKDHSDYDDRIHQVVLGINDKTMHNCHELLCISVSRESSHLSEIRPHPNEIRDSLLVTANMPIHPTVVLIDDVITAGASFKACKEAILTEYPNTIIKGVFLARRVLPSTSDDFDLIRLEDLFN